MRPEEEDDFGAIERMDDSSEYGTVPDSAPAPAARGGQGAFEGSSELQQGPWFVRFAGRRTGPHDMHRMRTLARRGALTRMHQVSIDGHEWASAATLRAIFQADGSVVPDGARASGLTLASDQLLESDDDSEAGAMPIARTLRSRLAAIASVRPVVVMALAVATVMLCLPTARDDAGALTWWWGEGALSIAVRAMAVLAVIGGWSIAFLAPEPARAASVSAVAAVFAGVGALPLVPWSPWAAVAALLVPAAAILVALDTSQSKAARPMGLATACAAVVVGLAEVTLMLFWRSGWSITGAALGVVGAAALVYAGVDAWKEKPAAQSRLFGAAVIGATGSIACIFAAAFEGLSGSTPMQGAQAAVSACLVLCFAALAWASVHETIDTAHALELAQQKFDSESS